MLAFLLPLASKIVDAAIAKIPDDEELGEKLIEICMHILRKAVKLTKTDIDDQLLAVVEKAILAREEAPAEAAMLNEERGLRSPFFINNLRINQSTGDPMSLYGRTDSNANKTKELVVECLPSSQAKQILFIDDTEAALAENKARGLNAPGWWSYFTYTDGEGNTRHKAEMLVTIAGPDLNANETQADDAAAADVSVLITINTQPASVAVAVGQPLVTWQLLLSLHLLAMLPTSVSVAEEVQPDVGSISVLINPSAPMMSILMLKKMLVPIKSQTHYNLMVLLK